MQHLQGIGHKDEGSGVRSYLVEALKKKPISVPGAYKRLCEEGSDGHLDIEDIQALLSAFLGISISVVQLAQAQPYESVEGGICVSMALSDEQRAILATSDGAVVGLHMTAVLLNHGSHYYAMWLNGGVLPVICNEDNGLLDGYLYVDPPVR